MSGHYEQPKPCNLTKPDIEKVAVRIAQSLEFTPGGDIKAVVAKLKGKIDFLSREDWLTHQYDTITVDGPGRFVIRLMRSDGPLRHRFTIAHELGHYFLHSRKGLHPIQAGRDGSDTRVEWEANWFAASFLMPEEEFRKATSELGSHPLRLAGRFLVSLEAAQIRLRTLHLQS